MTIHSTSRETGGDLETGCANFITSDVRCANLVVDFYNYFQHGVDFLVSGTTHTVRKIILHSNIVRKSVDYAPCVNNAFESLVLHYSNATSDVLGKSKVNQKMMKTVMIL
jgi:hypothetical protein